MAGMWQTFRGKRDNAVAHYVLLLSRTLQTGPPSTSCCSACKVQANAEALEVAQRALGTEPDHFLALQTAACLL